MVLAGKRPRAIPIHLAADALQVPAGQPRGDRNLGRPLQHPRRRPQRLCAGLDTAGEPGWGRLLPDDELFTGWRSLDDPGRLSVICIFGRKGGSIR